MSNHLPTGQWTGFYRESHQPRRGWMHLYLEFESQQIRGEGTDYVGPWNLTGQYDLEQQIASWAKQYIGQHRVNYQGKITPQGIVGEWDIRQSIRGSFHIWPVHLTELNEKYLQEDLQLDQSQARPQPSF